MRLTFNNNLINRYKSPSQKIRVLTENWVDSEVYCPNCGHFNVDKYENNRPFEDFFCPKCDENYELKSKKKNFGSKIVDGAYRTVIELLERGDNPNLFLLNYDFENLGVLDFFVVPKHFFAPDIIEKRKPLSSSARRAGWVGCNFLLNHIPQTGKIFFVRDKKIEPKEKVLAEWKKTLFLRDEKEISAKGWLIDVMNCVEKLGSKKFTLDEVYAFESFLNKKHPENKHIKAKIRQQLQVLRDKGYLDFVSRGYYRLA